MSETNGPLDLGSTGAAVTVVAVWAGERGRPSFLSTATPALSWRVETGIPDWQQASAVIEVRVDARSSESPWPSADSQNVPWPVGPLASYSQAAVRVRVEGTGGSRSEFSDWVPLVTGPLVASDWISPFVTVEASDEPKAAALPYRSTQRFRAVVIPRDEVVRATLSATAHGVYELVIGGTVVGDEVLAPGWTSYSDRLTFQTHDVTALITPGSLTDPANSSGSQNGATSVGPTAPFVLGATVAGGWYGEMFGFDGNFSRGYPGPIALSVQLHLLYADGSSETIVTDETWSATRSGPVVSASIYQGETFDARRADRALSDIGVMLPDGAPAQLLGNDHVPTSGAPVQPVADDSPAGGARAAARLEPAFSPPVRRIERVAVQSVITTPSGRTVVDFGQNLVGWLELSATVPEGHTVTLRHAEVLENGELGTRPLRFAEATDHYTGDGMPEQVWSPRFTFHGFRYAEVENWPGEFDPADVTAVVVHSDLVRTGHLETSNPKLNQLHQNVLWGMRGNFLSLPTDCPQRDERLGWTGDIQVFTPTASFLYDVSGFLGSWLKDLRAEQLVSGGVVPVIVPQPTGMPPMAAAAWGDAATLVPDALFDRYADTGRLVEQYPGMRDWVDVVDALAGVDHLWTGGFQFGDWLDPSAPPENPAAAKTDPDIVATAYFHRSALAVARAAEILGHDDDAEKYGALAEAVRVAFLNEYLTPAGRMLSDAHTAYALALGFDLIHDPAVRRRAGARLAELVRSHGYRIGTGFVGTPLICDALCLGGESDTAYRLLLEEGLPSWLYPISMGATTVWERWDSMLPDGSINPGEMTSFNHYALGSVADWMHRAIGGLTVAKHGGGRLVEVAPVLGGGLTSAHASLDSGYGTLSVAWTLERGRFGLTVTVPPNTRARVTLPGDDRTRGIGSGIHHFRADVSGLPAANTVDRAPYSMSTSLSEIVADAEATRAIETLFASQGYFIGLGWTKSGKWKSNSPLGGSLIMYRPENRAGLQHLLDELNARL